MADEVIPETGLADGETMRVTERAVILADGSTVWLRRYTVDDRGQRRWLADGRWCAQRGAEPHTFAVPQGTAGGHAWEYRNVHSFPSWQDALAGAREAEQRDGAARRRRAA